MAALAARQVQRGMQVTVAGDYRVWSVLERHPKTGWWWLHRRTTAGEWETTEAHYKQLTQII